MKLITLLIIDVMAIIYFAVATGVLVVHYKDAKDGIPSLLRSPVFIMIAGVCMIIVLIFFALGALMWEPPVNHYELIQEPLYRLKR